MKNSTVLKILGWIFIISSFIGKVDLFIICSSIFFSASFVTEEIEKLNGKNKL